MNYGVNYVTFNLINDRWIPVLRQDGTKDTIAPWHVTQESNPIISLNANRPDFNGALIQFFIGLVQTAMPPQSDKEWKNGLINPPKEADLKAAFGKVAPAFNLDGARPRFMQDYELKDAKSKSIDKLLVEMPGENTIKENGDHFIKRKTVEKICLSCSAMALFTLQTNAGKGGKGNRTSLRGGGPLTTVVIGDTLWQTIWLNVLKESDFIGNFDNSSKNTDKEIFPWMGPTSTSEKEQITTPEHVNTLQMFWGMPRRIVLNTDNCVTDVCDLCGRNDIVSMNYMSKNYGTKYKGKWRHILTPHRIVKNETYPMHGSQVPCGISYRYWLGLVQNDKDYGNEPAIVVHKFKERQAYFKERDSLRLWAFGYDFDNMKARCWYEGIMPLIIIDDDIRDDYEEIVSGLIRSSELVINNVRKFIKEAMFRRPRDIKGDLSFINNLFWVNTESNFYKILNDLRSSLTEGKDSTEIKLLWINIIFRTGMNLFDEYSQSNQIEIVDPKRIALARNKLRVFNSKNNKQIIKILDLPVVQSRDNVR